MNEHQPISPMAEAFLIQKLKRENTELIERLNERWSSTQQHIQNTIIRHQEDTRHYRARIRELEQSVEYHKRLAKQATDASNERDLKWQKGIEECCGTKIKFDAMTDHSAIPTLDQFINGMKREMKTLNAYIENLQNFVKGIVHGLLQPIPHITGFKREEDIEYWKNKIIEEAALLLKRENDHVFHRDARSWSPEKRTKKASSGSFQQEAES